MRSLLGCAALAALTACSSPPSPTPAVPGATAASTEPPDSSAPTGSASAVASAPVAPPPESPFLVAGELPTSSRLFAVEGALFVAGQDKIPRGDEAVYPVGVWKNGKLEFPKEFVLEGWFHRIDDIQGSWPEGVDMIAVSDTGRAALAEHFSLTASGWVAKGKPCTFQDCPANSRYLGMASHQNSLLAMQIAPMPYQLPQLKALRGSLPGFKLTPAPKSCPHDEGGMASAFSKVAVFPLVFGALRDGTLVAYGRHCSEKAAIEMWKPGGKGSTVTVLSFDAGEETFAVGGRLLKGTENRGWLLVGKLLSTDGTDWKEIPGPSDKPVEVGATGPDGTLWVSDGVSLFRRTESAWEKASLPEGASVPDDIAVDREGTVWVSAGNTLFRSRRPSETGQGAPLHVSATPKEKKPARKFAKIGGPRCTSNLVLLYGFTKVTPPEYDFPLTRKAVKGHLEFEGTRFVVVQDGGKKFFSAQVPSYDTGKKLVKLIEKEVKDSKPQLLCAEPEVQRELKINLKTGDVIPLESGFRRGESASPPDPLSVFADEGEERRGRICVDVCCWLPLPTEMGRGLGGEALPGPERNPL